MLTLVPLVVLRLVLLLVPLAAVRAARSEVLPLMMLAVARATRCAALHATARTT